MLAFLLKVNWVALILSFIFVFLHIRFFVCQVVEFFLFLELALLSYEVVKLRSMLYHAICNCVLAQSSAVSFLTWLNYWKRKSWSGAVTSSPFRSLISHLWGITYVAIFWQFGNVGRFEAERWLVAEVYICAGCLADFVSVHTLVCIICV